MHRFQRLPAADMRSGPSIALLVLGASVVAIGRLFGLVEMYVIGTGLMATAVLALVITTARFVHVDVSRTWSPADPVVGEDLMVELSLTSRRRTPTLEIREPISDPSSRSAGVVDLVVPPLPKARSTTVRYRFDTKSRGVVSLGPTSVDFGDPLGLVRRSRRFGPLDDVVIRPRWTKIDLPDPQNCEGSLVTAIARQTHLHSTDVEFRSLRQYSHGDDVRRINWRATARRDDMIVNEFDVLPDVLVHVVLDDSIDALGPQGFEDAVSIAASFVASAASQSIPVKLSFGAPQDSSIFDSVIDSATAPEAMRALAMVTRLDHDASPPPPTSRMALVVPVVITGSRSRSWLENICRSIGGSQIAVVIACEDNESLVLAPGWFLLRCRGLDDFSRQWVELSRARHGST